MSVFAYLRVSTTRQDVDNQRHGILEYCNQRSLTNLQFVEDTAPGKKKWRERRLGQLLDEAQAGDVVVFSEISRIARSTLQVLEVLEHCTEKGVHAHITKQNMVFDGSIQSRVTATVLGMAAEIEREMISMRTKEALAARKKDGKILGGPTGPANQYKLDPKRKQIEDLLKKEVSIRQIAKIVECAPSTLADYIRRESLRFEK
ncbi:recombinase family protein [Oceanospirillum beijerinckii]|uniref:recombinase family protein n=1 Tax=Oceanospirillum beijerinckii TaxID=64976 RepID=UPI000429C626|nr:recombinase family protein [Oceanospirillum beijerinckii]